MDNFWSKLEKPIMALAPMYDVTDAAFRAIIAKYSKPAELFVMFTEFVSADGLMHPKGREKLLTMLKYSEEERPIVAQLFTAHPDKMREAAKFCAELGFDGIDINMGCPDATIEKQGSGIALCKTPALAQELIAAAKEGAGELPVSVKTRLGYSKTDLTWLESLLKAKPAALTVHLRTREEMSKVPAHWELMPEIVKMAKGSGVLIIGNGDVSSRADGLSKIAVYGVDGVMIGRGIFEDPWAFDTSTPKKEPTHHELLELMMRHVRLFEATWGAEKNYAVLKKFYKIYIKGFDGASDWRVKAMETNSPQEVYPIINELLDNVR